MSARRYLLSIVLSSLILNGVAAPGGAQDDAATPLLRVTVETLPDPPAIVDLTGIALAPGAGIELTVPGPSIYSVESGMLGLRLEGPAQLIRTETGAPGTAEAAGPGVDYVLRPGDQAAVPANVPQLLLNDGQAPVKVLSTAIFPASSAVPSWLPQAELPPGVSIEPVASDVVSDSDNWPSGPARVSVVRVTVDVGSDIPSSMFGNVTMLVVEQGTLGVTADGVHELRYGPSEVARLGPGAAGPVRNAGDVPLMVLILAIDEAAPDTGTPFPEASPGASVLRDGSETGHWHMTVRFALSPLSVAYVRGNGFSADLPGPFQLSCSAEPSLSRDSMLGSSPGRLAAESRRPLRCLHVAPQESTGDRSQVAEDCPGSVYLRVVAGGEIAVS